MFPYCRAEGKVPRTCERDGESRITLAVLYQLSYPGDEFPLD